MRLYEYLLDPATIAEHAGQGGTPQTPGVSFSSGTYSESEVNADASITVNLTAVSTETVTVNYATSDGTATAGSDYTASSGMLTFIPGDTSETFNVPVMDDAEVEGNETVQLILSGPVNADMGSPVTATLTIIDDDALWEYDDPQNHGFDPVKLQEAANWIGANNSDGLVVIRDGYIVFEEYWNGIDEFTQRQGYSVTKSIASALVGIAEYEGFLDINEPAANYIGEWVGTASGTVTIRNLLSGDSGRYWDYSGDVFDGVAQPADVTQYAIERGQQFDPGTAWQYNHMAIQCLDRILSVATGMNTSNFAQVYLFDKLGMSHTTVALDDVGQMLMATGVDISSHDMACLGYLYLSQGMWNGERVLSEQFVMEATSPNQVNPACGYLWWGNPDGGWYEPITLAYHEEGKVFPDAPLDAFVAFGREGQLIFVSPSDNLVFVRQGHDPGGFNPTLYSSIYREIAKAFTN